MGGVRLFMPIEIALPVIAGLFGLMIGSFLNVCIHRLPRQESVVTPRSRCPQCGASIAWYDNIPIFSYLHLGGRCRQCQTPIGARYAYVEAATGVIFVAHAIVIGPDPLLAPRLCLAAIVIALFAIDLEHQILPNAITLPGIAAGLVASLFVHPPDLGASLEGAALGAGVLLAIRWGWRRAAGVDGMGLGDVKMLAMIGAFLGWQAVLLTLFIGSLAGAIVGISLAALGRGTMKSRLPFGTFLGAAALVASLWGTHLVAWYAGWYR